jgi:hypothetical protein
MRRHVAAPSVLASRRERSLVRRGVLERARRDLDQGHGEHQRLLLQLVVVERLVVEQRVEQLVLERRLDQHVERQLQLER